MITPKQARESIDCLDDNCSHNPDVEAAFFTLLEFVQQYEDWVKVKKVTRGALLEPGEE